MKVVGIVQARMGSSRLPGKVLRPLAGEPMLARVVSRLSRAGSIDEVVVATSDHFRERPIVELCRARHWSFFRGSEHDVLDRHYCAAIAHKADVVVRVTSDCPLIDPEIVDAVVSALLANPASDAASNVIPHRTFPRGLDAEAVRVTALERAWREDTNPAWREHVTQYIHRRPELFRITSVTNGEDLSELRWTVDTTEDLELLRRIYGHFPDDRFAWRDVLSLLERHPDWLELNRHIEQKRVGE